MDNELRDVAVVIPALNPDDALLSLAEQLRCVGFSHIIVVDDGSGPEFAPLFSKAQSAYGCVVLRHAVNLGMGRAIKTAFNYILTERTDICGAVTMDADGRHCAQEAAACAEALLARPDALVLAYPSPAYLKGMPRGDRMARQFERNAVRFLSGIRVTDPQTSLRGLSCSVMSRFLATKGERYEYGMNMLLDTRDMDIPICEVCIEHPSVGWDRHTHFRPLLDSLRIYAVFLEFIVSSLSSYALDIVLFSIFVPIMRSMTARFFIPAAAYTARLFSASFNYIINKKTIFKSHERTRSTMLRYFLLCLLQITLSAFLTDVVVRLTRVSATVVKMFVDTLLFFFSFTVQKNWVFRVGSKGED